MRNVLGAALAAFLCVGAATPAGAGLLGVTVDPTIGFSLDNAVEITDDGNTLTIVNGAGNPLTSFGIPGVTTNAFDLLVTGESLVAPSPVVELFVDGEASLAGELVDVALAAGVIELLFSVIEDGFGVFGSEVLMVLTGEWPVAQRLGTPLEVFDASVVLNPVVGEAAVPAPAPLPLLALGLAGLALISARCPTGVAAMNGSPSRR